jgi:hypothetical protein
MKQEYLGISVQTPNIVTVLGMKQVAQAASGEQGTMIRLYMIINSVGNTVPQFSTFQEQNFMTV